MSEDEREDIEKNDSVEADSSRSGKSYIIPSLLAPLLLRDEVYTTILATQAFQPRIDDSPEKIESAIAEIRARLHEIDKKLDELPEHDRTIEKVNEILGLDISEVPTILSHQRLVERIDLIESTMSVKIDATTKIIDAYDKVLNKQSEVLTWIKWGIVLGPIATIVVALINFFK